MNHNPFATRFTAPGSAPYLAEAGLCARLHEEWLRNGRTGAILGPHGCGKSTLLATLEQRWTQEHAYCVTRVALHDGQRALPSEVWQREYQERDLLIVDGYEQLGWRARWQLQRLRRRTSCGLLVTAHMAVRLPMLYCVEPSYATWLAVVRRLLEPCVDSLQAENFVTRHALTAWEQAGGNVREALFWLYDCWEESSQGRKTLDAMPCRKIQGLTTLATPIKLTGYSGQRDASESAGAPCRRTDSKPYRFDAILKKLQSKLNIFASTRE